MSVEAGQTLSHYRLIEKIGRLWKVGFEGGEPELLSEEEVGVELAWAPGAEILSRLSSNRNYRFHEADGTPGRLLAEDLGWMFHARYRHDGSRVAVLWNRPGGQKIWVVSIDDGAAVPAYEPAHARPVGWSEDDRWLYVLEINPARISAVSEQGQVREIVELTVAVSPVATFGEVDCAAGLNGRVFVCAVPEKESDVWLVENLEPPAP